MSSRRSPTSTQKRVATSPSTPTSATPRRWPETGRCPAKRALEHRIGGIEKSGESGNISYDPGNHHRMTLLRAEKVARIANDIPPLEVTGPDSGDLLVLGWGGTYGAITSAAERARKQRQERQLGPPAAT